MFPWNYMNQLHLHQQMNLWFLFTKKIAVALDFSKRDQQLIAHAINHAAI